MKTAHQENQHKAKQTRKNSEKMRDKSGGYIHLTDVQNINKHKEKVTALYNSDSQHVGHDTFESMTLLQELHIRYPAYQMFILGYITIAK